MDGKASYNRNEEDLGNVVNLGHVNTTVPDQRLATLFYIAGLGLTRDPFLMTGTDNMWVNVGVSQFHLPTRGPQVLRGVTGLVIADRGKLLDRLTAVRKELDGTAFAFRESGGFVETTSPWGNRIHVHEPDERRFGDVALGMAYVEFGVAPGNAPKIARFYREILGAPVHVEGNGHDAAARILVGYLQHLVYRETDRPIPAYDGHHVQIYVADFSGPYERLRARGLISEESSRHQYRFKDIVDLDTGEVLFVLDHETRSMTHPLYARPLVNRNPAQNVRDYRPGYDDRSWAMA